MLGDIDKVIKNAKKAGVNKIITAGTDTNTNKFAFSQAEKYNEIECVLGVYPDEILKYYNEKEIDKVFRYIRDRKDKIAGIGEVGMDFKNIEKKGGEKAKEKQEKYFRKFVALSIELDKPIVVHSRQTEKECIEILEEMKAKKVIMHCFFGDLELVKRIIKNKWYISIPTCCKRNKHFWDVIKITDIKQLLCETDSPFMHPNGNKDEEGKFRNNFPENVVVSYKKIAELKGKSLKEVENQIKNNYSELFD